MPELVTNGPDLPTQLLNELYSGKVIFFCGAGVSKGMGSNLPLFDELVENLINNNQILLDDLENEAKELKAWDRVLGLLEREERLGPNFVRQDIIKQLSVEPSGTLLLHNALIKLARINPANTEEGIRLVTTNFDRRFIDAGLNEKNIDAAPKLPVPDPSRWRSIVHLHGIIQNSDNSEIAPDSGENLVLTTADFGRAYLTERWAARFITELFRLYTIVFVGYGLNDPVMRYMVDAIATEKANNKDQFNKVYAFAGISEDQPNEISSEKTKWKAKGVVPIIYYYKGNNHSLMVDTFVEWARIRTDPFKSRQEIVINGIGKIPSGDNHHSVNRVIWALDDPITAEAISKTDPISNKFILEKWLDQFTKSNLLSCPSDPGYKVSLLNTHYGNLDNTRKALAQFLTNHLHLPELLKWCLENGGNPHPYFQELINKELSNQSSNIPEKTKLFWSVLVNQISVDSNQVFWLAKLWETNQSNHLYKYYEDKIIKEITPHLVVIPRGSERKSLKKIYPELDVIIDPIEEFSHLELVTIEEDNWLYLKDILINTSFLSRHAETLTGYLENVHSLSELADLNVEQTYFRKSISDHEQDKYSKEFKYLINLVRDSYQVLKETDKQRAKNLLNRWVDSQWLLFKRLALHALTEDEYADIKHTRKLLLDGEKPGIWEIGMRREVLRFFRLAGDRLPKDLALELEIELNNRQLDKNNKIYQLEYYKKLCLHRLSYSGVKLSESSTKFLKENQINLKDEPNESDEFKHISGIPKPTWVNRSDLAPIEYVNGDTSKLVKGLKSGKLNQDEFVGLMFIQPEKVFAALKSLASQNYWEREYWELFLSELETITFRSTEIAFSYRDISLVLSKAPIKFFNLPGPNAGSIVSHLAKEFDINQITEFKVLWDKIWNGSSVCKEVNDLETDDPYSFSHRHPVGKLTETILTRLDKLQISESEGIPAELEYYFKKFTAEDTNGRISRMVLATDLHFLFYIDPKWTKKNLIEHMNIEKSEEASDLWSCYAYSTQMGPNLFSVIKPSYFNILKFRNLDVWVLERLVNLFIEICIEAPKELKNHEIKNVLNNLNEQGLVQVITNIHDRFTQQNETQKDLFCKEIIGPWFEKYWPKIGTVKTSKTSDAFLCLIANCGNSFTEIFEKIIPYLSPIDEYKNGLEDLFESDIPNNHPVETLKLLKSIKHGQLTTNQKSILKNILEQIKAANKSLVADRNFHELYNLANT